jgi:hypothetical protein
VLTRLECSTIPPWDALTFARFEVEPFMVFLHPRIPRPPHELWVELRGQVRPHVCAYWEGLAYLV